jgi:hypothetical protein
MRTGTGLTTHHEIEAGTNRALTRCARFVTQRRERGFSAIVGDQLVDVGQRADPCEGHAVDLGAGGDNGVTPDWS